MFISIRALKGAIVKFTILEFNALTGMERYSGFQPTAFDCKGLALDNQQGWFVVPVARNRDSEVLAESNFAATVKALRKTGPEASDGEEGDWEIHRFGHWANGWFEIIVVREGTEAFKVAEEIEGALADYPVLDESDYSERECEAAEETWKWFSKRDRIRVCQRAGVSIFAARHDFPPSECFEYLTGC
jgi:hypothetical protein